MPKLSVILPTYNEAEGITGFLKVLLESLAQNAQAEQKTLFEYAEVLVVDDSSPDGTAKVVAAFARKQPVVKLIVRRQEPGLGLSILTGIQAAHGEIIVGMDADNNHDPRLIAQLVHALESADLVVASRFITGGGMQEKGRYFTTYAFNVILRVLGFPTWDNGSGFYAVKRQKLQTLPLSEIYYGYGDYHLRLVFYVAKLGWRIKEIPTVYLSRIAGQSKSKLGFMAVSYLKEAIRLRFTQW